MPTHTKPYKWDDLIPKRGIYYKKNDDIPFTGMVRAFHKNGQLFDKQELKNGKCDGSHEVYYDNGQLHVRSFYIKGNRDGFFEMFYKNGRKKMRCFYKNGVHGDVLSWSKSGETKDLLKG